jgi:hypothetical protein
MASLYGDGWRQGSIIEVDLPLDAIVLGDSGRPERASTDHGVWVVVTQDCDLDRAERDAPVPVVELRPVFTEGCPSDWGIRSAKLRLTEVEYVEAASPRAIVAPNVLTAALDGGAARRDVSFARRQGLKTWLGLRYDRPAVPDHLVSLAQRIGKEVARPKHRTIAARVRDVLMQFDDSGSPVRYSLFAVLDDPADEEEVRVWLAQVSHAVPSDLGVADQIEAADASGIAFSTIESSYSADVSLVTWRRDQPDPEGVT